MAGLETGEENSGDGDGDGDYDQLQFTVNHDVDILFVIDNSASMGWAQAKLATSISAFINELVADDANYRIGFTTTDNGNPWCPAGMTTPEGGKLVMSPCTSRLGDFVFEDLVDVQNPACIDICPLSPADLEILPTFTDVDPSLTPRPWLELNEHEKNIPETTNMADAFACFAPQGINGCGFESPLESMYLALVRAETDAELSYGFLRATAILAIVLVSDETDCSYNKDYSTIFEADGNKVFWSDPTAAFPTSAVCWNAGVECVGDPSGYDSCDPVNKDVDGNSDVSDADAVLHPMSRYIGRLQGLEQQKQDFNVDQEVIVALIGGVGSAGDVFYADVTNTDPAFQDGYGIGPGCTATNPLDANPLMAVPPVRERVLTETFTADGMYSICEDDFSPALEAIATRITDQIRPACYTKCAADTNSNTPELEPECTIEENRPGEDSVVLEECLRDGNGYVIDPVLNDYSMPSDSVNVCYALRTDSTFLTASPADDLSQECLELNFNLELEIARRPGFPAPSGTAITGDCLLADDAQVTCPGIGGG
jgi:hypothetical protein